MVAWIALITREWKMQYRLQINWIVSPLVSSLANSSAQIKTIIFVICFLDIIYDPNYRAFHTFFANWFSHSHFAADCLWSRQGTYLFNCISGFDLTTHPPPPPPPGGGVVASSLFSAPFLPAVEVLMCRVPFLIGNLRTRWYIVALSTDSFFARLLSE